MATTTYTTPTSGTLTWSTPSTWSGGTPPPTGYYPGKPFSVTGTSSGTGGVVRVTVSATFPSTAGSSATTWAVGDPVVVDGVLGTTEANGSHTISALDTTSHLWIELTGTTYANAYVSGGRLTRAEYAIVKTNTTLDQPVCIGGYVNGTGNGGVMEVGGSGGTLTIAANFVIRGSCYTWSSGGISWTAGSVTIDYGASGLSCNLAYGAAFHANPTSGRLALTGTGTSGLAFMNSVNSAGTVSMTNVDVSNVGNSTYPAVYLQGSTSSASHLISGCTFATTGGITTSGFLDNTVNFQLLNTRFTATTATANAVSLGFTTTTPSGSGQRTITGCSFDKCCNFSSSVVGLAVSDCYFGAAFNVPAVPTAAWTTFQRCFVGNASANTLIYYGSTTDLYEYKTAAVANPHFHSLAGFAHNPVVTGSIFEVPFFDNQNVTGSPDFGDLVLSNSGTTAVTNCTVTGCLSIPTYPGNNGSGLDQGFGPGCMTLFGASTGTKFSIYKNTIHVGYAGGRIINIGEGVGAAVASVPVLRDNIAYDTVGSGSERAWVTTQGASPTTDAMTGSGAKYNGWWRLLTTGIGGGDGLWNVSLSSSGTPGANDVHAAPLFAVDPATSLAGCRRLATWAQTSVVGSVSGTDAGRITDAMTALSANPYLIGQATTGLLAWVRAGYAPTNAALHNTASDGGDIGAVAYATVGPTTATITGPSSGAVSAASTNFTVTLNTAAPLGGTTIALASSVGGDTFTPSSLTITSGNTTGTFTITPGSSPGSRTITPTASGITFSPTTLAYTGLDITPPVLASAAVNAAGTTLTVTFTETSSPPVLPASGATGFTLSASGGAVTLSSPAISGTTYTATTSRAIYNGEIITLAYSPGNVTDSATSPNALVAFSLSAVTNNSTAVHPLTAGVASFVSAGPGEISVTATAATGGTPTYTYQWQRNASGGAYANLSGATSLSLTDATAVSGTLYGYKCVATDSAGTPATATSNAVTAQIYIGGSLTGSASSVFGCLFIKG